MPLNKTGFTNEVKKLFRNKTKDFMNKLITSKNSNDLEIIFESLGGELANIIDKYIRSADYRLNVGTQLTVNIAGTPSPGVTTIPGVVTIN